MALKVVTTAELRSWVSENGGRGVSKNHSSHDAGRDTNRTIILKRLRWEDDKMAQHSEFIFSMALVAFFDFQA